MTLRKLFQTRDLTLLWAGQVISQSGDSIYLIGLLWLALELSASKTVTGLVAMSAYLPAMLFALAAGVAADRYDRRRVMLAADAVRAVAVLGIPLAALLGRLSPALLAADAFAIAIAATFFNPARDAVIPQIVPREGLLRANSLVQTSWQLAMLLGPAAAGVLLHRVGNIHLFTADAGAYVFSFLCILLLRPRSQPAPTEERKPGLHEVLEGLRYVLRQPVILPLLLITVADNLFIMGPAIVGTPVFIKDVLSGRAQDYALIQACYAVGMLAGTAWLVTFGGRIRKGKLLLVGMFLDGITYVPYFFVRSLPLLAAATIVHAMAIPLLTVPRASLIQGIVPQRMTGRVFALVSLAVTGMSAVSSGITGVVLEWVPAPTLFLAIGLSGALCGVLGLALMKDLRRAG